MRVSIRKSDSGFLTWARLHAQLQRVLIKLNGEQVSDAITADDEAGVVVRYVTNEAGNQLWDTDRETFVDEVVHGKVEIEVTDALVL